MNLKKAKKLKVGDTVALSYPCRCEATITEIKPDSDPRVKLLFSVLIKDDPCILNNLNYLHIKMKVS